MKMELKSILLLMGVSLIIFTGFKNPDVRGPQALQVNTKPTAVAITVISDFSTPDVSGTFATGGALTISGTSTMDIVFNANGTSAHSVITLYAPGGTITIHQECNFAHFPPKGQWQIVSGTGPYADLKGNGSLLMPSNFELMVGVIH
jgi:hypothetical protein